MAGILIQHSDFGQLNNSQQDFSPPSREFQAREIPLHRINGIQGEVMAQPLMQRQFRPEVAVHNHGWPTQRAMPRASGDYSGTLAVEGHPSHAMTAKVSLRGGYARGEETLVWNHGLPMEPFVMPDGVHQFELNSGLSYESIMAAQNLSGKGGYEYASGPSWPFPGMISLPGQVGVFSESDLESNTVSPSPKSYFSDPPERHQPYTPQAGTDRPSPNSSWAGVETVAHHEVKRSPSQESKAGILGLDVHAVQTSQTARRVDHARPQQVGLGFPLPEGRTQDPTSGATIATSHTGIQASPSEWIGPYFHNGSASGRLWQPSEYSNGLTGLPYFPQNLPASGSFDYSRDSSASSYAAHTGPLVSHRPYRQEAETRRNVSTQDAFQVDRSETQAQRQMEDGILLDGKAAGLTYKEIRKKMRTKVAESTLRGRYRSLTKARKDRVRKPLWTEKDIRLLKEIVRSELDRLDDGYRASNKEQRLAKVSWKKVAEYIAERGGSYHFGNSTCKKKWAEIDSGR